MRNVSQPMSPHRLALVFGCLLLHGGFSTVAVADLPVAASDLCAAMHSDDTAVAGGVYDQLLEKGVGPIGESFFKIAAPSIAGKPDEVKLEEAKKLAGRIGWTRFSKDSVYAPVAINIESIKNEKGQKVAHRIHCAFVLYGQLDELKNQELLENILLASSEDGKQDTDDPDGQELSEGELEAAGIEAASEEESYAKISFSLFNRVKVSGVIHAERIELPDAVGAAWQFDSRFGGDLAGQWRKLGKNKLGAPVVGEANEYTGCGGLMLVQKIDSERLLVESSMIMHEPPEWFSGSQFLRSKLPTGMQENARSFRRKLDQARK